METELDRLADPAHKRQRGFSALLVCLLFRHRSNVPGTRDVIVNTGRARGGGRRSETMRTAAAICRERRRPPPRFFGMAGYGKHHTFSHRHSRLIKPKAVHFFVDTR